MILPLWLRCRRCKVIKQRVTDLKTSAVPLLVKERRRCLRHLWHWGRCRFVEKRRAM